ncbi:MAG: protein kinase, partial [Halobacteriovoraceae bacterium]|nr:protein kinase [Halobacteriovoraceae bacterium]
MSDDDEIEIPEEDAQDNGIEFSDEDLSSELEVGDQSQSSISRAKLTAQNIKDGEDPDAPDDDSLLDFEDSMDSELILGEKMSKEAEVSDRQRLIQEARMRKEARARGEVPEGEEEPEEEEEEEEDDNVYPKRYGKYLVLDHLTDGGMAKICIARYLGEEANKMVAIKMVQKKFSADPDFKQMFIDELKVSFGLQHPNIATTFDYGSINSRLYVSMEFIHGRDLDQITKRLNEQGKKWSIPAACYCISKAAEALHYAHTFKDNLSGECLKIVHRDISPHNIMLTYDGNPKLIDFGIASADPEEEKKEEDSSEEPELDENGEVVAGGSEATADEEEAPEEEEQAIKGKISYMAPEILEGKEVDGRYDLFALGLSLYEMLVGERVFLGETDIDTLRQIMLCQIERPSNKREDIPEYLDEIILKCLERDPVNRYANMEKFNRDLTKFLFKEYPDFNAADVGPFVSEIFAEEIARDRDKFMEYGKIDMVAVVKEIEEEEARKKEIAESGDGEKTRQIKIMNFDFAEVHSALDGGIEALVLDFDAKLSRAELAKKNREAQQSNMLKMIEKKSGGGGNATSIFSLLDIEESELAAPKKEKIKRPRKPMTPEAKKLLFAIAGVFVLGVLIFSGQFDSLPGKIAGMIDNLPFMKDQPAPVAEVAKPVLVAPEVIEPAPVAENPAKEGEPETLNNVINTVEATVEKVKEEVVNKGTDADLGKVAKTIESGVKEVGAEVQKGVAHEVKDVTEKITEIKKTHIKNIAKTPAQIKADLDAKFKAIEESDKKNQVVKIDPSQVKEQAPDSAPKGETATIEKKPEANSRKPASLEKNGQEEDSAKALK